MKKSIAFLIIVILSSIAINNVSAANQDVVINEIGAYEGADYEWVEIYNRGSAPIDINGWKFVENFIDSNPGGTNHGLNFIQGGSILSAGQYAVIAQNDVKFKEKYPTYSGILIDSSWSSLNESGERIGVKDPDGNFAELFTYIEAKSFSLERKDANLNDYTAANWQEHLSGNTVGAPNSNPANQNTQENNQQTATQENQQTNSESTITNTQTPTSNPPIGGQASNLIADAGENIIALIEQEITFDASKSQGSIASYEWNFGDGAISKDKIAKHKYNFSGKYIAVLEVSDGQSKAQSQITVSIYPSGIYINEFLPSPAGSDKDNEWIEIYNSNNSPVDISGWTINDNSKKSFSFPPNTFISKQSYLVIPRATTGMALNNDADTLRFSYPENILIEEIKYEKAKEGYSASRKQDLSFIWTKNPTPSAPNIISGENISAQNIDGRKQAVSIEIDQNKTQNLTKSNQKFIVANGEFIAKNLINTAQAHHVEEEIFNENNSDSQSTKSETNANSSTKAGLSANISQAIQNKNFIKIFLVLATLGIFALMWRVFKKTNNK